MKFILYFLTILIAIPTYSQVITPNKKYPGVYIEEIPSGNPILSASTNTTFFIGCTEKNLYNQTYGTPITSLYEFEKKFGGAPSPKLELINYNDPSAITLKEVKNSRYFLYHSVVLFFKNGGKECYIHSIGNYDKGIDKNIILKTLNIVKKRALADLYVVPDASLLSRTDRAAIQQRMLNNAEETNSFAILDVYEENDTELSTDNFRADIAMEGLGHGAAYYPWLVTDFYKDIDLADYIVDWESYNISSDSSLYTAIQTAAQNYLNRLPPSGAMAGIYAKTDVEEGVWKAPANVSIKGISGFTTQLTNATQSDLNISAFDGKSINGLRTFTGRGHLVWGARTLAGNDNEWRYVPVRRLGIFIEESIDYYLRSVVFEPNDANTWKFVESNINAFMTNLWKEGGLAGASPKDAFSVQVGLGKTMTANDILEGKMIVSVMFAPVRPAEFIILNFGIKMAE